MVVNHFRVFTDQELPADREARVLLRLRNTGFLQQGQRGAAGADKDKLSLDNPFLVAIVRIRQRDAPALIGIALKAAYHGTQLKREIVMGLQPGDQLTGDFTVVYVGADFRAGCGHLLLRIASFHHQRSPLFNLLMIFGVADTAEQLALL